MISEGLCDTETFVNNRFINVSNDEWCVPKCKWNHFNAFKGIVHPKMKMVSFTHPQVDPNLYECVCSEHKGRYSEE